MFDGLPCNERLKLKTCETRSTVRYVKSISDKGYNCNPEKARDLQEARMSLVKAETSKTHLEQRVEELSRRLQGDTERLAVYERRSLAVNGATRHIGAEGGSQEQQLDADVADLRSVIHVAIFCATYSRLFLVLRSKWRR